MSAKVPGADKLIGARLKLQRKQAGLSQSELGAALGVSFQQIQKYENGKNRISGSSLVTLCKLLGTTPDQLLGVKRQAVGENAADLLDDVSVRKALLAVAALPVGKRIAFARALTTLAESYK